MSYKQYTKSQLERWLETAIRLEKYETASSIKKELDIRCDIESGTIFFWCTEFKAIESSSGKLKTYGGENIPSLTLDLAQKWCDKNKPWLKVIGKLVSEIPCKNGYEPDFDNQIDYQE